VTSPLQTREIALDHYADRQRFVNATARVAAAMWADVDPRNIAQSWAQQLPELTAVVSGAQLGAARPADSYTSLALQSQDVESESVAPVDPTGFSGQASDGRGLMSLLTNPVVVTLLSIQDGLDVARALGMGRANLDMLTRTQVADAGRLADQVALTARPAASGYTRVAVGNTCARCLILAGKHYAWNAGFKRHPMCDCVHLPSGSTKAKRLFRDPRDIYDSMTRAERLRAGFTLADQQALRLGADLEQLVNARHRPGALFTAGGRKLTREGSTRRGLAGKRLGAGRRKADRLTPDQIFAEADGRAEALDMLFDNGYLLTRPRATASATVLRQADDFGLRSAGGSVGIPGLRQPVAAAVDPALKMTLPQIKAAAKAAGAPIVGTRKADILANLRLWESGNARKIPGLPEFRPAPLFTNRIDAPVLGKPDPSGPKLTGHRHHEWSEAFDGRLGAGLDTPSEGVVVRDLRVTQAALGGSFPAYTVEHGTAWRFNGVSYLVEHGPDEFGAPWVSRTLQDLREAHASVLAAARVNKSYAALKGASPDDVYWQRRYNNPDHVSLAQAGQGHTVLWSIGPTRRVDVDTLRHETGHNLDDSIGPVANGSGSRAWAQAADDDVAVARAVQDLAPTHHSAGGLGQVEPRRDWPKGVTEYGRSSKGEDWAESLMLYQSGPIARGTLADGFTGALYFRDIYPHRAAILDKLFPDLAKAQKAEIAALRAVPDLAKMKVAELRALAQKLGIPIPPGAKRSDLLERLQVPEPTLAGMTRYVPGHVRQPSNVSRADWQLLHGYAAGDFGPANRVLRGIESGGQPALADAFDRLMAGSRTTEEVLVFRGLRTGQGVFGPRDQWPTDFTGFEWVDRGFLSTSLSESSALKFAQNVGGDPGVVLRIRVPPGTGALDLRQAPLAESEILLERGLKLRVVGQSERQIGGKPARILDVEIVPIRPTSVTPPTSRAAEKAAIVRQKAIDKARATANLLAEVDELLQSQASARALRARITARASVEGTPATVTKALLAAVDDPDKLRAALARLAKSSKLTVSTPDQFAAFDRALMEALGDAVPGQMVRVLRPGYTAVVNGERVVVSRASVQLMTPDEVTAFRRAEREAVAEARRQTLARSEGTARLLAEVDELLGKKATAVTIRQRLDPKLFATADPDVLQALRVALESGDMLKLRSAVTRLTTKAKVKPISKAGAKVKFDPDTMDSGGATIPKGAQVQVVTRGSSIVVDGETLVLTKPQVVAVGKPPKPAGAPTVETLTRLRRPQSATLSAKATNPRNGTTVDGPTYRDAGRAGQPWTPDMGPLPWGAYEQNCTNVVMAWEMRMRGFDVTAGALDVLDKYGYAAGRTFDEYEELLRAWRLPDGRPHGRTFAGQKWLSDAELEAVVAQWPDGARGLIHAGKHTFSVIKVNGKMQFIEAQNGATSGAVTAAYRKRFGARDYGAWKYIRLDDLVPSDDILRYIETLTD
jgi:hypothetical protein